MVEGGADVSEGAKSLKKKRRESLSNLAIHDYEKAPDR